MIFKKSVVHSMLLGLSLTASTYASHAVVLDTEQQTNINAQVVTDSNPIVSGRLIVKYAESTLLSTQAAAPNAVAAQATRVSGKKMKHVRRMGNGAHVLQATGTVRKNDLAQTIATLTADSTVLYVEEDKLLTIQATPNDPSYSSQWHYYETTGGLNLPDAWDDSTGQGVVVAVIDTGYRPHADLVGNILPGYDMISDATIGNDGDARDSDARDPGDWTAANECQGGTSARSSSWHGTHVAGTIAAVTNNNSGVAGVAYDAKIVPVRVLGKCGGFTSDIADGMIWAAGGNVPGVPANANPAQVLNLSLGGGGSCGATTQSAINQAVALGATVVVAAGNSAQNASNANPANCNNVVTVAATGRSGGRAPYSNYGNVVDIAAPGGDTSTGTSDGVLSTLNSGSTLPAGDSLAYYQGTSMAAPHVAGAVALLYAADPTITPAEAESILKTTSRSFPSSCNGCGDGIVDAAAAVSAVSGGSGPGDSELENGQPVSGLFGSQGNQQYFIVEVPAGASDLIVRTTGGSGDADLYVRFGAQPTTSVYDCRPYLSGNNETCTISNTQAGTYHVMLRGYSAFSGLTIEAEFTEGGGSEPESISESGLSASRNNWLNYQLDVPAGQASFNVVINGGSGDADLYVRRGANPTTSSYDCRPYRNGNNETCTFSNPVAGTYYIRLRAYSTFSGVSLNASSQ